MIPSVEGEGSKKIETFASTFGGMGMCVVLEALAKVGRGKKKNGHCYTMRELE